MHPRNPRFKFSGSLDAAPLNTLNHLLIPLAFLRIERGYLDGVQWEIKGDHRRLNGWVSARYHNLKVSLLKHRAPPKRRGLASFIVNHLILRSNPQKNGALRVAKVDLKRDPQRGFFNWTWLGLLDGLKRSAGI